MSSIKSSPPSSTVAGSDETVAELELVNTERAARGLWLVKVPKYLSQEWEKHDGEQVGKLVVDGGSIRLVSTIQPSSTGTEVGFTSRRATIISHIPISYHHYRFRKPMPSPPSTPST